MPYVFCMMPRKFDHQAGLCASALNGEMTRRLSASRYADGYCASDAIPAAKVAASARPMLPDMSGINMILNPGSTAAAACSIRLALAQSWGTEPFCSWSTSKLKPSRPAAAACRTSACMSRKRQSDPASGPLPSGRLRRKPPYAAWIPPSPLGAR